MCKEKHSIKTLQTICNICIHFECCGSDSLRVKTVYEARSLIKNKYLIRNVF